MIALVDTWILISPLACAAFGYWLRGLEVEYIVIVADDRASIEESKR